MLGFISSIEITRWYYWAYTIRWSHSEACVVVSLGHGQGAVWVVPEQNLCPVVTFVCSFSLPAPLHLHFFPYCWSYVPWLGTNIPQGKQSIYFLLPQIVPHPPLMFHLLLQGMFKISIYSFRRCHIKGKRDRERWKELWGQWKGGIGEVVNWDSLVDPYAGRNRGRLCPDQWNVFLSPKGSQDTDIMEEIFNILILNVLQILEGNS